VNRLLRLGACLSLITALLVVAVLGAPSRALAQDGATTGSLQSIAHGVSPLSTGALAWRVVGERADAPDSAAPATLAVGFTLATDGLILVEVPATGAQDVLAPGSAAFVGEGTDQASSALADSTAYDQIALVSASQASEAGDGELILGGEGFGSPGGNRALDLSRAVLAAGQSVISPVPDSPTPALVLATDGSVDVAFGGETITVPAGSAAVLDGELTISSTNGGTVVIATIGAEVPALASGAATTSPAPSATTTPRAGTPAAGGSSGDGIDEGTGSANAGTGTLDLSVLDCSGGSLLDTATCAPLAGVSVTLVIDGAESAVVTDGQGVVSTPGIAVGSAVTVSLVSGGPEGLELLNVPFAIPSFEGDTVVPIVFDAPAEEPVAGAPGTTDPTTGGPVTGGTPVGGAPATESVLTIQAVDCRQGDIVSFEGCVAMPNATFSVTRSTDADSTESGFTTDANGFVTFTAAPGSSVTATYAFGAPTGVAPNNDGQVLEPVEGDATLTFVFVDINESNG
jgi:hypothetical protein